MASSHSRESPTRIANDTRVTAKRDRTHRLLASWRLEGSRRQVGNEQKEPNKRAGLRCGHNRGRVHAPTRRPRNCKRCCGILSDHFFHEFPFADRTGKLTRGCATSSVGADLPQRSKVGGRNPRNRENQDLELVVVVLAEAGRNEGAGLRGADGLARAGFGENDVPEVGVWRAEGDANKTPLTLLAQRSHVTLG